MLINLENEVFKIEDEAEAQVGEQKVRRMNEGGDSTRCFSHMTIAS